VSRGVVLLILCIVLGSCAKPHAPLDDLAGYQDLSRFTIQSVHGVRDGDRLAAQVMVSDSSSIFTIDLHFAIGSPTRFESGSWRWSRPTGETHGTVVARSVTFLGGQDDGPSIGGTFDLLGDFLRARLTLPLTVLPRVIKQQNP
jgi:hypothetical protein